MSESTINVPKVGRVKRSYVIGAAAAVAAFVLWRYWSAGSSEPAAEEPSDTDVDDSSVTDTPGGPLANDRTGNTYSDENTSGTITTNEQWSAAVLDRLSITGYDSTTIVAALGKYLSRQQVTTAEAIIIRAGIAVAGYPPVGGPYQIIESTAPAPGTSHANTPQTPDAPRIQARHRDYLVIDWNPVRDATTYAIEVNGKIRTMGNTTQAVQRGLKPKTAYRIRVRSGNSKGWSKWSAGINTTTTAKG